MDLEVRAGEMSIHHNKTMHSSMPSPSDQPRIGFAVHIAPSHVRQTQFEGVTASVVRGQDRHGNWVPDISAKRNMDPDCLVALDHAWQNYRKYMKAPYED